MISVYPGLLHVPLALATFPLGESLKWTFLIVAITNSNFSASQTAEEDGEVKLSDPMLRPSPASGGEMVETICIHKFPRLTAQGV
jgi:hypothetical protein